MSGIRARRTRGEGGGVGCRKGPTAAFCARPLSFFLTDAGLVKSAPGLSRGVESLTDTKLEELLSLLLLLHVLGLLHHPLVLVFYRPLVVLVSDEVLRSSDPWDPHRSKHTRDKTSAHGGKAACYARRSMTPDYRIARARGAYKSGHMEITATPEVGGGGLFTKIDPGLMQCQAKQTQVGGEDKNSINFPSSVGRGGWGGCHTACQPRNLRGSFLLGCPALNELSCQC